MGLMEREQRGLTRGSALKLGAAGILGAALGGLLPGRAGAAGITAAPCRPGQGYRCGTVGTTCGAPGKGCGCATQYTGSKLQNTNSYCVDMNVCCDTLNTCPNGQSQCPSGYICSSTTCCGEPVCLPPCGASVTPAACCLTPSGQAGNDCQTCSTGGNCDNGTFNRCSPCTNGGPDALGYYCFTGIGGSPVCAANTYCAEAPSCTSNADCGAGYVCIVSTGCNCAYDSGVCVALCSTPTSSPKTPVKRGAMTAAGIRY